MDDAWSSKSTGLPRPSKLPMPGQSKLPTPRLVRPSPSMNTLLVGSSNASGVAGATLLRNAKLRSTPSREQLTADARDPKPAASTRTVSSSQLDTSFVRPAAGVSGIASRNTQKLANGSSIRSSPAQPRVSRIGRLSTGLPSARSAIGQSARTPSRVQPPQQCMLTDTQDDQDTPLALQNHDDIATFRPRTLTERTIETLSTLPSSPSVRGKGAASFYDRGSSQNRAPSRPRSRASRLSSSHQSDVSSRGASRPGSRPGSSSGADEDVSNFRATLAAYRPAMSPIDGTPRGRASIGAYVVSSPVRITAGGTIRGLRTKVSSPSLIGRPRSRSPSPGKPAEHRATARFGYGSKTVAAGPAKSRPSLNGLFKKPSVPALDKTGVMRPPRKLSSTSVRSSATSNEGTNPSAASPTSSSTTLTVESPDAASTNRKSSAALREQIAKAKAAKRAAAYKLAAPQTEFGQPRSPLIPTDASFDFGLAPDPFNQGRDANSQAKVLQGRLGSARTSGRLNIAAMGLRELPSQILNMYNLESITDNGGGSWAESVDLSRFVAADNELEMIDESFFPDVDLQDLANDEDSQGNIFGGLETLDLHGNMLISLPRGLRRLPLLTSLNLASNRLANNCLEVISQITTLRDLKLGGNLLFGPLDPCFANLVNLEILDLHGNRISALPSNFGKLNRLRILNINENEFEALPFDLLAALPLTELNACKNQLKGTLILDSVTSLPTLQTLDVSFNRLTHLVSPAGVSMPALHQLSASMNRLQALPNVTSWTNLVTLSVAENSVSFIPDGFAGLNKLRSVDLSSNDIRVVPAEIGLMDNLAMLRLSGNPLRDKKFTTASTDELKQALALRLQPMSDALETQDDVNIIHAIGEPPAAAINVDGNQSDTDDFATPPTSVSNSPVRQSKARM